MRKTQHGMFKCLIVLEKPEEVLTVGELAHRLLVDETTLRFRSDHVAASNQASELQDQEIYHGNVDEMRSSDSRSSF